MIIAIDPGGTTGVAVWEEGMPPWSRQIEGRYDVFEWLEDFANVRCVALVVEDFRPRPGARSWQPDALRIIGYCEGLAHIRNWNFVLQTPAEAKSFTTDKKLRALGLWRKGEDHARDAYRHLIRYLCTTEHGRHAEGGQAVLEFLVAEGDA